jgi:hypothetical protein
MMFLLFHRYPVDVPPALFLIFNASFPFYPVADSFYTCHPDFLSFIYLFCKKRKGIWQFLLCVFLFSSFPVFKPYFFNSYFENLSHFEKN